MAAPTITDHLKYASLQMAAEAFIRDEESKDLRGTGDDLVRVLTRGNAHTSRFPESEARKFADTWEVLDQRANTPTGFSGTLFRRVRDDPATGAKAGELVLSFRSTEFIDDTVRDNEATNVKEIKETGWAWGQIADMETWYDELRRDPGKLQGQTFSVTGYSLGGHLATAFHLLHSDDVKEVVTFNGAGVGKVKSGGFPDGLRAALDAFNDLRSDPERMAFALSSASPAIATLYREVRSHLADGSWTVAQASDAVRGSTLTGDLISDPAREAFAHEKKRLQTALEEITKLQADIVRVAGFTAGGEGEGAASSPKAVPAEEIRGLDLDYRLAVSFAAERTVSAGLLGGVVRSIGKKADGEPMFANQYDLVGWETTTAVWSAAAHSLWHHGSDVRIFIEDQPFSRGNVLSEVTKESLKARDFKGLVDHYAVNDFGDNHSLVLIIDSLSVQNALLQLVPETQRAATAAALDTVLRQASWHQAESNSGTQGKAEGDVLETVVNALADLLLGPQPHALRLQGSLDGNTFAKTGNIGRYSGRDALYARLDDITGSEAYRALAGQLTLKVVDADIEYAARSDFAAFAALYTLSPFVLSSDHPEILEATLSSAWSDLYSDWAADRAALAHGADPFSLRISDAWLRDRADFRQRLLWFNANNKNPEQVTFNPEKDNHRYQTDSTYFEDSFSATKIAQGFPSDSPLTSVRRYTFGDGEANMLSGGEVDDHLYGGTGNDTLNGKHGADYLEGNADNDTLDGGGDNDTLNGGPGDDVLIGGDGEDTYVINRGDGNDRVVDTGRNFLKYNGKLIAGLFVQNPDSDTYTFVGDEGFEIKFHSPGVLTLDDRTSLTFDHYSSPESFAESDFGIRLAQAPDAAKITREIVGDRQIVDFNPALEGIQPRYDELQNPISDSAIPVPGASDILHNSVGNDHMILGDGFNMALAVPDAAGQNQPFITQRTGDDWIVGGKKVDFVIGGSGRDTIEGGAGGFDLLAGGDADDIVFADRAETLALQVREAGNNERGDLVSGQGGHDILYGSPSTDLLYGGAGNDFLGGLGGDDYLLGDQDRFVYGAWHVHRNGFEFVFELTAIDGQFQEGPTGSGNDTITGDKGNDVVWAGAGNDDVDGGDDDDILWGEDGNDFLVGGNGEDFLHGGADDDTLEGSAGNDTLIGAGGGDKLQGGSGNDNLQGDAGGSAVAEQGDDRLYGDAGDDILEGFAGSDTLFGGDGDDDLYGDTDLTPLASQGNDLLNGGTGNDTLRGYAGNDTLEGGGDNDSLLGEAGQDFLSGDAGRDQLSGGDDNDTLTGGADRDYLEGGGGNDSLVGGTGIDYLTGDAGDDHYLFASGDSLPDGSGMTERVVDREGSNTIVFLDATSAELRLDSFAGTLIIDYGRSDRLSVVDGVIGSVQHYQFAHGETLIFSELIGRQADAPMSEDRDGSSFRFGGEHDDDLTATAGHATLSGGRGNDILHGEGGGNTYLYSLGDGSDRIIDRSPKIDATGSRLFNTLRFGAGIMPDDLKLELGSLRIRVGSDPDDAIHIDGFNPDDALGISTPPAIDRFEFDGGAVLTYPELLAKGFDLVGTAGNDTLGGTSVSDRLEGGAGNDHLRGGGGSDTYSWGIGSGQDLIDNVDTSTSKIDTLAIGNELLPGDLVLGRNGDDLIVSVRGTDDRLTVLRHYAGAPIDVIRFADGRQWSVLEIDEHLENRLTEGDDIRTGTPGNDILDALAGDDVVDGMAGDDEIDGGSGNDTLRGGDGKDLLSGGDGSDSLHGDGDDDSLDGGGGADQLDGGRGGDTYRFGHGSGSDRIVDTGEAGASDVIVLAAELTPEDLKLSREGSDLILQIIGSGDRLTVVDAFAPGAAAKAVERIMFSGSATVWAANDIRARLLADAATAGNDMITGLEDTANRIFGLDGNDTLSGGALPDLLDGGNGNDLLNGLWGDDLLLGGAGDDVLNGEAGADTLSGGPGQDALGGETGGDTYVFARGDGSDMITDSDLTPGHVDTLQFPDLRAADVRDTLRANNDLVILFSAADRVTVKNQFLAAANELERFSFTDGTVWDAASVRAGLTAIGGSAGDDTITGAASAANRIYGLDGHDRLKGGAQSDLLDGGNGNDFLDGLAGSDTLVGGLGHDIFVVDDAGEVIVENVGEGSDTVEASISFDLLAKGAHVEELILSGASALAGTGNALDNSMRGNSAANVLLGGAGNDSLYGASGNDTLDGGIGNDYLNGGGGNGDDTYRFGRGSGQDRLVDNKVITRDDVDVVSLGEGISPQDITFSAMTNQSWLLSLAETSDTLELVADSGLRYGNGQPVIPIRRIQFADGLLASLSGALVGTASNDNLYLYVRPFGSGTVPVRIRMDGGAGNDTMNGDTGNDTLRGGIGNDLIYGDTSDARGNDEIYGDDGDDTLCGGSSIYGRQGTDLLDGGTGNDVLYGAGTVRYGRGYGQDRVIHRADRIDLFDFLPGDISLQYRTDGLYFNVNASDWLKIETTERRITVDSVSFADGSSWDRRAIEARVAGQGNLAPQVDVQLAPVPAVKGQPLSYVLPENAFRDPNSGDSLIWSVSGPYWFSFDPATRRVSGTPENVGSTTLTVTVSDSGGAAAYQFLEVRVRETNHAPMVNRTIPSMIVQEGVPINLSIPADTFIDEDAGDTLTFAATLASGGVLPTWLVFDARTGTIGGTPPVGELGDLGLRIMASDGLGASAATPLTLRIVAPTGSSIAGTAGNDTLNGKSGNDWLNGGMGADTMSGGQGDDTYVVDDAGDLVIESLNEGVDSVQSSVSHTLANHVEHLTLTGSAPINGIGNGLNNRITGNGGNNVLNGGLGADTLVGGPGDDHYTVDQTGDRVVEAADEGNDIVHSPISWVLGDHLERLDLTGSDPVDATGNDLANLLYGQANSAANVLAGGPGNDIYHLGVGDRAVENADQGHDSVYGYGNEHTLAANVENLYLAVTGAATLTGNELANSLRGNAGDDLLSGQAGNDTLNGGLGNDLLEGGSGNDTLTDSSGSTLFNGDAGNDILSGGADAEIYLGGVGNDTLRTGAGNDVIIFNRGDGRDTLVASDSGQCVLSLGGSVAYTDLSFSRSNGDLIVTIGSGDQITFKDWYAAGPNPAIRSVLRLQVIAEAMADFDAGGGDPLRDQKVETFDFAGLVDAFDAARSADPTLTDWALSDALTRFQLAGSDSAALGGDLAYQYGRNGSLTGIGVTPAMGVLADPAFGNSAQALTPLVGLQIGTQRLA
ncbi:calcium-binding protein [Candidatus Accumulibacter phosphatis]|uniref:Alkaline phosphatase n=1 Tax=Candidatus Accumulibacter phosphatis TaxID=327160 RepID=A0A5S4EIL4_9PROT|nr:calcium-binding protein [Candidatus Accumulibacter phosphatis]TMQ75131.1 Alkaline phosphatase [Candidatus Accumulibacter phosphatis]